MMLSESRNLTIDNELVTRAGLHPVKVLNNAFFPQNLVIRGEHSSRFHRTQP